MIRRLREKWTALRMKIVKEPEWVPVYQSQEEYSVRIKKLTLEDAGIPTMIFDQRDSSYNAFGYIYLHVRNQDLERSKQLLNIPHE